MEFHWSRVKNMSSRSLICPVVTKEQNRRNRKRKAKEKKRKKEKEARFSKNQRRARNVAETLLALLRPGFNDIHPEQIRSLFRAANLFEIRRLAPGSPRIGLSRSRRGRGDRRPRVRARPHVETCERIVDTRAPAGHMRARVRACACVCRKNTRVIRREPERSASSPAERKWTSWRRCRISRRGLSGSRTVALPTCCEPATVPSSTD